MESPPWSQTTRITVIILCLIAFIALVVVAFPLIEALAIAALFAYLLNPAIRYLIRRWRMSRSWAVVLVYVLILLFLAALPATLGTVAFGAFRQWGDNLIGILEEIREWLSQPIIIYGFDVSPRILLENLRDTISGALTTIPGGSIGALSAITTNFLWVLTAIVSLYYFLKDGPKIKSWLISITPETYRWEIERLLDDLNIVWSLFLRAQLIIFVVLAILMIVGSLIVIWLYQMGWLPFSTLGLIVMLVIVYALVQQVDNLWLRPQLLGHQLRLHPGVVFVGLVGGLALSGVLGALVAVPMIASSKVIGHYIRCKLLDQPPWEDEGGENYSEPESNGADE